MNYIEKSMAWDKAAMSNIGPIIVENGGLSPI